MRGSLGSTSLGVFVLGANGPDVIAPTIHDAVLTDFMSVDVGALTVVDALTFITVSASHFDLVAR